jgi:hypothetical protein
MQLISATNLHRKMGVRSGETLRTSLFGKARANRLAHRPDLHVQIKKCWPGVKWRTILWMKIHFEKLTSNDSSFLSFERIDSEFPFYWHYHPEFELALIADSHGRRLLYRSRSFVKI